MISKRILTMALSLLMVFIGSALAINAETIYGITANIPLENDATYTVQNLVRFDSATPATITTIGPITGIAAGYTLRSIDFRLTNNTLFGIATGNNALGGAAPTVVNAQRYTINVNTGVATPVGGGFLLSGPAPNSPNTDKRVELEYNPVTGMFTVLTAANVSPNGSPFSTYNNFTVSPAGALVSTDTILRYHEFVGDVNSGAVDITIIGAAYSNPVGGNTTLYGWDSGGNIGDYLVAIGGINGNPKNGVLDTIPNTLRTGRLTVDGTSLGFDISPNSGTAYATLLENTLFNNQMGLYTRNLSTGAITLVQKYAAGTYVVDIAVPRILTAGGVEVSGRVLADGRTGLRSATVTMTDESGNVRSTLTGSRGTFLFEDVEVGKSYTLTVTARRYSFAPQVISLTDSVSGITFTPQSAPEIGR